MVLKRKVIFITDGDEAARKAVECAAADLGGRCISRSAGNPSTLNGEQLLSYIFETSVDPVLVMFDDCGYRELGPGEKAMQVVAKHPNIEVIGAIAVASSTHCSEWTDVNVSIDRFGDLTEFGVDKEGLPDLEKGRINGDTVYVLDQLNIPIIIGIGDIGKMAGRDSVEKGAPITKKAVEIILERSGYHESNKGKANTDITRN
ncbi:stage V sporulation protein AE [Halalkalibacter hemicellulosilyticus]|uniref:Stage V sporulation protein AE n=1 Tax=Halalkalibacter hemicellulosilyticusJCM 9152 TaxID=1236971 RepID=W4QI58_9BACI|nr:stage V sporulation protein AE [Halalkalibacter hemicellulosilyticus]GAE31004.1 stage V sporulation protein AE [Halalkalibacter hemicellulosilyticusJCM 9152]